VRPGEVLVSCDVFEDIQTLSSKGQAEHDTYHASLRRAEFERNYLGYHPALPTIIAAPSATLDADA
jgi:hypothetical protein